MGYAQRFEELCMEEGLTHSVWTEDIKIKNMTLFSLLCNNSRRSPKKERASSEGAAFSTTRG